ncbi:MAG: hypothetical protein RIK87_24750 [Fuerstiella sp.]
MVPTIESTACFPAASLPLAVDTNADVASPVLHKANRDLWQKFISEKLVEWGANPEYFDDEDVEPPRPPIIALALRYAKQLRDTDELPPHRVVPDGSGGIIFERRNGGESLKLHFWDDGTVEQIIMDGTQVVARERLD